MVLRFVLDFLGVAVSVVAAVVVIVPVAVPVVFDVAVAVLICGGDLVVMLFMVVSCRWWCCWLGVPAPHQMRKVEAWRAERMQAKPLKITGYTGNVRYDDT